MRSRVWRFAIGPLITAGVAGVIWLLDRLGIPVPAPGGLVMLAIVYSAWVGGLVPGYASAVIFLAAAAPAVLEKTHFITLSYNPSVIAIAATAFAIGVPPVIVWLRSRADHRLEQERRTRERVEAASRELQFLQAALDHVDDGVILLDEQLRARFINRASRRQWKIPEAVARRMPFFGDLLHNAWASGVVSVPADKVDAHIEWRLAQLRGGDERPIDVQLADGTTVRCRCKALPAGGRFLSYSDVTDLVRHAKTLERLATIDDLTEICNRRHFMALAREPWERFHLAGDPLSLLILDLDLFKSVNDRFGHDAGDAVIRHFANVCRRDMYDTDILARLGGEEFVMLLPDTCSEEAAARAEQLRRRIEAAPLSLGDAMVRITASIGVAEADAGMTRFTDLLKRADKALYEAKRGGRNRVRSARPAADEATRRVESSVAAA
jgi:diguanylate cyclase (GGDEF)-like protein